jgi:hypothetical protein
VALNGREVFVPQSYEQGQEGQVDWFEAVVKLDGELRTLQFFAMRSMAYPCVALSSYQAFRLYGRCCLQ